VLDATGVLAALARSCDVDDVTAFGAEEEWNGWRSTGSVHRTFWVRRWPTGQPAEAMRWLTAQLPATTHLSVTLSAPEGSDPYTLRCLIRVAAPEAEIDPACDALLRRARQRHLDLFPLDGEHGPAVYASAPTGGAAQ
jgi:hypothetical protein